MKRVRIFVKTSLRGPAVQSRKYTGIVEYKLPDRTETRTVSGTEVSTTYNRAILIAAIRAMEILKVPCEVELHTDNKFVANMIQQDNPERWRRSEWKRAGGAEIGNKELWQQYADLADIHTITAIWEEAGEYDTDLKKAMKNIRF